MITVTESATRLYLEGDYLEINSIYEHFKFRPPDYWRSPAYALWKRTRDTQNPRGWDGYLSRVRTLNGRTYMMRGHRDDLVDFLDESGYQVKYKLLESPFKGLAIDDVPDNIIKADFKLDHNQRECIAGMLQRAIGTVRVTVSGGKTAIFFSAFAMVKGIFPQARALYITPTERLVNQVFKEGRKFLPDMDITQFGGGKRDWSGKDIVVATAASVSSNLAELKAQKWLSSFMVLLVDEVHHAAAPSWSAIISSTPAFFRFGASDTVKDERKEDIVKRWEIQGLIGPSRAEIGVAPLIDVGRVAKPYLFLIDIPEWEGRYDDLSHQAEIGTPAWTLVNDQWLRGIYRGPGMERDDETGEIKYDRFKRPIQAPGFQTIEIDGEVAEYESRWCLLRRTYDVAIIRNKERNAMIVKWVKHFAADGDPTLVVATRTLHVHILKTLIDETGLECETLTSADDTKERDRVFTWLMAKPGRVLISPLVKEGVNLPELRAGVVADVVASPDLARQIIGRFIRKKPTGDNHARIAWFIDRSYPSARHNCLKLFEELERVRGYGYYYPCAEPTQIGPLYGEASFD